MKRFLVLVMLISILSTNIVVYADDTSEVSYTDDLSLYAKSVLKGMTKVDSVSSLSNNTYAYNSGGGIEYKKSDGTTGTIPKGLVSSQRAFEVLGGEGAAIKIQAVSNLLKGKGYSDEAIAGVLGNGITESTLNPEAGLSSNSAANKCVFGAYQTDLNRLSQAPKISGCSHTLKDVQGYKICVDLGCQTLFALYSMEQDFSRCISNYNSYETGYNRAIEAKVSIPSGPYKADYTFLIPPNKLTKVSSYNDFITIKDASSASLIFMCVYERCAGINLNRDGYSANMATDNSVYNTVGKFFVHEWNWLNGRPYKANCIMTLFGGMSGTYEEATKLSNDMLQTAIKSGYYSEEDLGRYNRLTEQNIQSELLDDAVRDNLSSNELSNLTDWENNIEQDSQEGGLIYYARIIVSIFGIILIIWTILIYIAFWFDRLNNFIDIDLLLILTLGKLRISDTDDECTFSLKDAGKGGVKTVNHRAILMVCIISITFGVLVISGTLYTILSKLVYLVLDFLN